MLLKHHPDGLRSRSLLDGLDGEYGSPDAVSDGLENGDLLLGDDDGEEFTDDFGDDFDGGGR